MAAAAASIDCAAALAPAGAQAAYAGPAADGRNRRACGQQHGSGIQRRRPDRGFKYAVGRFNEQDRGIRLELAAAVIERGAEAAGLVGAHAGGAGPSFYVGPTTDGGSRTYWGARRPCGRGAATGDWTPLDAGMSVGGQGGATLPWLHGVEFRVNAEAGAAQGAAGPILQTVTHTATCAGPGP